MLKLVIICLAIIAFLGVIVVVAAKLSSGASGKPDVYYLRRALFTPAERSYLGVLESNLPRDVRVFGKVRHEDI